MKRAIIYARVSYDDTKTGGRNLQGQLEDGRAYCQDQGYQVVAELAEDDRGASGADWDLPMLNQALDMARRGEADVLITRELDRFARELAKQLVVEREFQQAGVEIEYIIGEYPDTPEGRLNKHIRASVAEFERELVIRRLRRGRYDVVKEGKVLLHGKNRAPYGYRLSGDRMLNIHEPEARIVRMIFDWYIYGDENGERLSARGIAARLTKMRVPTTADVRQEQAYKKAQGHGTWHEGTIRKILSNETYAGVWYYGKWGKDKNRKGKRGKPKAKLNPREQWMAVEVLPIISREIWEKAQKRKARNKEMAARNTRHDYLVGRHVTCGLCGSKMLGRPAQGRSKKYFYYNCPAQEKRIANKTCNLPYFRADEVDEAVRIWLITLLLSPRRLHEELERQQAEQERTLKPLQNRLAVIDDLLADNRGQLEKLLDLYLSGDFDKTMLTERKTRLETTITALEKERADLAMTLETSTLTADQIIAFEDFAAKTAWELGAAYEDFETMRHVVDFLDVKVTLTIENNQKVIYAQCTIRPEERLPISPEEVERMYIEKPAPDSWAP